MPIEAYIGKSLNNPVTNPQLSQADLEAKWDAPQKMRNKAVGAALSDGTNLVHTYLMYVPGLVTYCTIGPLPVWTGDMTGCFLFRFRMNGKLCAAHVGTDSTDEDKNRHAKATWLALMNNPEVSDVWGCDPGKDIPTTTLQRVMAARRPSNITGWWETNGAMRIVTLLGAHGNWRTKEIFSVDLAPLRPWSVLANDRKFRVTP